MPLYKTITVDPHTRVFLWKIEESYEALYNGVVLTEDCKLRLAGMRSEIHRKGFLSIRHLLQATGYDASDLYYDTFGKPYLKDGTHISITHSFSFSAIIISREFEVGIDVEMQREKIVRIADKFVGYEWGYLPKDQLVEQLSVLWCAKESLYKGFGRAGVSFKQHCRVIPFDLFAQRTKAWVHYKNAAEKYDICFFPVEGFMCAYALKR